jgi:hypothetical protein
MKGCSREVVVGWFETHSRNFYIGTEEDRKKCSTAILSLYISVRPSIHLPTHPPTYLPTCLPTYLSIYLPTYLPLSIYSPLSIGLLGRGISPSQGRHLNTQDSTNTINAHKHPCLKLDSNPRSQYLCGRRQFMPWTAQRHMSSTEYRGICGFIFERDGVSGGLVTVSWGSSWYYATVTTTLWAHLVTYFTKRKSNILELQIWWDLLIK